MIVINEESRVIDIKLTFEIFTPEYESIFDMKTELNDYYKLSGTSFNLKILKIDGKSITYGGSLEGKVKTKHIPLTINRFREHGWWLKRTIPVEEGWQFKPIALFVGGAKEEDYLRGKPPKSQPRGYSKKLRR